MPNQSDDTPMMRQYAAAKRRHPDSILFFRLGDFYEMFRQDAQEASRILGLTLTQRNGIAMCGVPYHAAQSYIARLLRAGKKVAVCEQTQMPEGGRGLATREVTEVVTPGTVTDEAYLASNANNYLVSIAAFDERVVEAYVDLSTGELAVAEHGRDDTLNFVRRELARLSPREILVQESLLEAEGSLLPILEEIDGMLVNRLPDWDYDRERGAGRLRELLGVSNLKGFGLDDDAPAFGAVSVLLDYLQDTARSVLSHIRGIEIVRERDFVILDDATQRNLELVRNLQDGSGRRTLLSLLDETKTAPGARMLRRWTLAPLVDTEAISDRQERVSVLYRDQLLLQRVREELGQILDIERLTARVAMQKAHAKDLVALRVSLERAFTVVEILPGWFPEGLTGSEKGAGDAALRELAGLLRDALQDAPSVVLHEGNMIRDGYSSDLDELRRLKKNSRGILDAYLEEERRSGGISSLKLKYNRILGYFFETTKAGAERVPEHFVRRQSLSTAERYGTPRLAELEDEINSAEDRIVELERRLFIELRDRTAREIPRLEEAARRIAETDVVQALAWTATLHGFVRPQVDDSLHLDVRQGRHPVVEAFLGPGEFVANDAVLDAERRRFALMTGPNMSGKSTYLRQTALIVLMAQIGSFVPAQSARIGVVNRVFCRVGASDNLARGESTFLVEMNETANILRNADERSLVIMDEVGRGTSTNDGLAIARAVTEYVVDQLRARTLFATHYHELTDLALEGLFNMSMKTVETDDGILFSKRVQEEPSRTSYGIHVARLAGLPWTVVSRAQQVLKGLEGEGTGHSTASVARGAGRSGGDGSGAGGVADSSPATASRGHGPGTQGSLFEPAELLLQELRSVDVDHLTPIDALNLLARWKRDL
jgi:DNA mismatch repair protein MutS